MNVGVKAQRLFTDIGDMRRPVFLPCALAACATVAAVLPASAPAAQPQSTITYVSPTRVKAGQTLALRGRAFSSRRKSNTVIFRGAAGRVLLVKPRRNAPRRLRVKLPRAIDRLLTVGANGDRRPTRLRIRVQVRKKFGKWTTVTRSPIVVPSSAAGLALPRPPAPGGPHAPDPPAPQPDAEPCGSGDDYDGDLLSNALEENIDTDPCKADTDGDTVEDGFEYFSARDLNQDAVPYPGSRPFANPLDPSDAGNDYDSDGMSNKEEFDAWAHAPANPPASLYQFYTANMQAPAYGGPYAGRPTFGAHTLPLNYSDGDQTTVDVTTEHPEYRTYLDFDGDGRLYDGERDVDGDGLRNVTELRGLMTIEYYPEGSECGYQYEPLLPRPFPRVGYMDWDSDGDRVWDGDDDQDSDDVSNVDEVKPPHARCLADSPALPVGGAQDALPARRSPFNPCLPYQSRSCSRG